MKGGNMHILFYFDIDQTIGTLHEDAIGHPPGKKKQLKKGAHVMVQRGEDVHVAEIVAYSQDKKYLEELGYDWSSKEIVKPGTTVKTQQEKNMAKKRALAKGQKEVAEARKKTVLKYNQILLQSTRKDEKSIIKSETIKAGSSSKSGKSSRRKSSTVPTKDGNKFALNNPEGREEETVTVELEGERIVNLLSCQFCSSVQELINPEVTTVLEHCVAHLKSLSAEKSGGERKKSLPWQIPAYGKIQLMPNSDVWVESSTLETLTTLYKEKWKELLRRLLKSFVGEVELATMTAAGGSDKPGIPPILYNAVQDYVQAHCKIKLKAKEKSAPFNRTVNLMCCRLAKKFGISSAQEKENDSQHMSSAHEKENESTDERTESEVSDGEPPVLKRRAKKRPLPKSAAIVLSSEDSGEFYAFLEKPTSQKDLQFPKGVGCVSGKNGERSDAAGGPMALDVRDNRSSQPKRRRLAGSPKKRSVYDADRSAFEDMSDWLKQVVPGEDSEAEKENSPSMKNESTKLRVSLAASRSGNFSIESGDLEESKGKKMTTSTPEKSQHKKKRSYQNDSNYILGLHPANSSTLNETKSSGRSRNNLEVPVPKDDIIKSKNSVNFNGVNGGVQNHQPSPLTDGRQEENSSQDPGSNTNKENFYTQSFASAAGQPQYSGPPQQQWNFPSSTYPQSAPQATYQGSYANPYYHQYNNYPPGYYGSMDQPSNDQMTDPSLCNQNYVYRPL